jgi:hypothetical protein
MNRTADQILLGEDHVNRMARQLLHAVEFEIEHPCALLKCALKDATFWWALPSNHPDIQVRWTSNHLLGRLEVYYREFKELIRWTMFDKKAPWELVLKRTEDVNRLVTGTLELRRRLNLRISETNRERLLIPKTFLVPRDGSIGEKIDLIALGSDHG